MTVHKLFGPPGTGKTRTLTAEGQRLITQTGPHRFAAVTFTRTAAAELRERLILSLGFGPGPTDAWARRRWLNERLPWVGTIHSIALKLIGPRRVLSARDLTRFIRDQGGHPTLDENESPEDAEGYLWDAPGRDEVEAALAVYSMSRHRMIELAQAYAEAQWGYRGPPLGPTQVMHLVRAYEDFKHDLGKLDFEDMLEQGMGMELPIDVLLVDEVQDNSPLLWSVLDRWGADKLAGLAGDPYQALYIWSGADPALFIDHPGTLHRLGNSHRLTQAAADRAQTVLREAGYTEGEWLGTWTGKASGERKDGTTFWLARTGRLLQQVRRDLEDAGTPYAYIRGGGPLATKESDAFRVLQRLRTRGSVEAGGLALLAQHNTRVEKAHAKRLEAIARSSPDEQMGIGEAEAQLGHSLAGLEWGFGRAQYLNRVLAQHGTEAFRYPPKTLIGTIHSAKGREADEVNLVDSWGTLPARALDDPAGRRAEACVAYVGLTRHRARLNLVPADEGVPYPF